ncbi:MAG TPA: hypothetical protein VKV39_20060 [Candidatus Sulfotelmatobacter sp.]|nr:hypothetical protein [Candidatus Sulfotelmatobacter sp.]
MFKSTLIVAFSWLVGLLVLFAMPALASDPINVPAVYVPLPLEQVVTNLVRKNQERAQSLRSVIATRVYHLEYRGFPGDRDAYMTVRAAYANPAGKDFDVLSEDGSKFLRDRVFKKLLEDEKEAATGEAQSRMLLNRSNYDFAMVRYEPDSRQYVLQVNPKSKGKYLYRGQVWVDGTDFAVTRIVAEPAQNPSFWTKHSEFRHEYVKVQGFWVPARNQSVSYIRLGGRATLTIEYKDYDLNGSPANAISSATAIRE